MIVEIVKFVYVVAIVFTIAFSYVWSCGNRLRVDSFLAPCSGDARGQDQGEPLQDSDHVLLIVCDHQQHGDDGRVRGVLR